MGLIDSNFLAGAAPGVTQMGAQLTAYGMTKSLQDQQEQARRDMEERIAERNQSFTAGEATKQREFTAGESGKQRNFLSGQTEKDLAHQMKKEKNNDVRARVSALQDAVKAEQESIKQDRLDLQGAGYTEEQAATMKADIETRAQGVAGKIKVLDNYAKTGTFGIPKEEKGAVDPDNPLWLKLPPPPEKTESTTAPPTGIIDEQRGDLVVPAKGKYASTPAGAAQAKADEAVKTQSEESAKAARKSVEQYTLKAAKGIGDVSLAIFALQVEEKHPGTLTAYEKEQALKLTSK